MKVKKIIKTCELGRRLVKQGPRMGVPPPTPCDKLAQGGTNTFNVLQVNINGLQNKTTEVLKVLNDNNVHIALIQETILGQLKVTTSGYTQYKCTCEKCQGIMTLVRNDIEAKVSNETCGQIDHQKIQVWLKGKTTQRLTIHNVYCPPPSKESLPNLEPTLKKTIVAGDLNAHLPTLGYKQYNNRGREVEDMCNSTTLEMMQSKDTPPTFLHRAHGTTSRPDLTFVSADMRENCSFF